MIYYAYLNVSLSVIGVSPVLRLSINELERKKKEKRKEKRLGVLGVGRGTGCFILKLKFQEKMSLE